MLVLAEPDFTVMPTGIMSDVNARLVKRKYRKCESIFDSKSSNALKLDEKRQFLSYESFHFFMCESKLLGFEYFPVNCFIHPNPPRLTFQVV